MRFESIQNGGKSNRILQALTARFCSWEVQNVMMYDEEKKKQHDFVKKCLFENRLDTILRLWPWVKKSAPRVITHRLSW